MVACSQTIENEKEARSKNNMQQPVDEENINNNKCKDNNNGATGNKVSPSQSVPNNNSSKEIVAPANKITKLPPRELEHDEKKNEG